MWRPLAMLKGGQENSGRIEERMGIRTELLRHGAVWMRTSPQSLPLHLLTRSRAPPPRSSFHHHTPARMGNTYLYLCTAIVLLLSFFGLHKVDRSGVYLIICSELGSRHMAERLPPENNEERRHHPGVKRPNVRYLVRYLRFRRLTNATSTQFCLS